MLADKSDDQEFRELFLFSNKSIRKTRLPEAYGLAPGSSCGWLLTVREDFSSQLINPLSREITNLPKLDTITKAIHYSHLYGLIQKVVLLMESKLVFVIWDYDNLGFCHIGDNKWTSVEPTNGIRDITFYNGLIYSIDRNNNILACNVNVKEPESERANKEGEMARAEDNINSSEVHTFYEFVAFLNLIKNDEIVSKGWDTYMERFDKVLKWFYNHYLKRQLPGPIPPIIHRVQIYLFDLYKLVDYMGGYLSVNFGQEFDVIAEILGLTKGDGKEIKRCYISYLDVFTSYYKIARAPQIPTKVKEDLESLVSYQWNMDRTCVPKAVQNEKEKLKHFRIKLEDETDCNIQQTTQYEQNKDRICKRPSTSRISNKKGSYRSTSDDYIIIT
nr:bulb-type lectin domain-containing protein [Tanacetum cinerariifolium]